MSVRPAVFSDIPEIVRLMKESHKRSIYADITTFDNDGAHSLCRDSLSRHRHVNFGGTLVLVSHKEGHVGGYIIGFLDHVAPALKELMVTDILFYCSDDADPRDAAVMIGELTAWGLSSPKCIELHLGVTGAIGNWERVGQLYERLGLEKCGGMWRRSLIAPEQEAVNA